MDFARRLYLITGLEIAGALCLLVVGGALFVFGSFVASLRGDVSNTFGMVQTALHSDPGVRDAPAAGAVVASHYLRSDIVVMLFDQRRRVDVYKEKRTDPTPVVRMSQRSMPIPGSQTAGPLGRVIVGIATAFGLQSLRGSVNGLDLIVRESDASLVAAASIFVAPFFGALILAMLVGFVMARVLTQQALRPLIEVTEALERFASGDLTPHPVVADGRQQLGRLAVAYNGAVAQMERAFAQRERANAGMRQFIADAGHQLRTPLTVLRGFIAILRKGELRTPADRERILETMNRQGQLMSSLVDKLMLLERWEEDGEQPHPEAIDVARLVEDVVAPLAEANPGRAVRVDVATSELVAIDPIDLTHAVGNIVDNALKYTTGAIEVSVGRAGDRVVVIVRDEGPGMSALEVRHAFDRFFRGSRRDVDGTGLGLAIARRAVERAGGSMTLESDPARGSRFTISLPATGEKRATPRSPAAVRAEAATRP